MERRGRKIKVRRRKKEKIRKREEKIRHRKEAELKKGNEWKIVNSRTQK